MELKMSLIQIYVAWERGELEKKDSQNFFSCYLLNLKLN